MTKLITKLSTIIAGILISIFLFTPSVNAQSADVAALEFVNIPNEIKALNDYRFSIKAVDTAGNPVETYTGTVEFKSDTDQNAIIPTEYTFTVEDKGVHEFTESYYFTQAGIQTLTVLDKDDLTLEEVISITVFEEDQQGSTPLTVSAPSPGVTTNPVITVRGQTTPGLEVTIVNETEVLGLVDADSNGDFEFESSTLPDGNYKIKVLAGNSESDVIAIVINTQAPDLTFSQIDPEIVLPGATSELIVRLEDVARTVIAIINGTKTTLTKDPINNKQFTGTIIAPIAEGNYEITLSIEDELGNTKSNVVIGKSLQVSNDIQIGTGSRGTGNTTDPVLLIPSQVINVQAMPGDKQIQLTWADANATAGIKNYIVYYGTSSDDLSLKIETFNAETNWYIPNLMNGQTYYFSIFAVDNNGNRGDLGSQIIAVTPSLEGTAGLVGSGAGQIIVGENPETGPATPFLLALGSLLTAKRLRKRKSKKVK